MSVQRCTRTDAHSIGDCPNYPAEVTVVLSEREAQALQVAFAALGNLGSIRPDWRADLTQAVALVARARDYRPLYDSGEMFPEDRDDIVVEQSGPMFLAYFEGQEEGFAVGATREAAIGNLIDGEEDTGGREDDRGLND